MANDTIKVDSFSTMVDVSSELSDIAGRYRALADELFNLTQNSSTVWRGEDNDKFKTEVSPIKEKLEDMAKKLENCSQGLKAQHDNYVNTINNNISECPKCV